MLSNLSLQDLLSFARTSKGEQGRDLVRALFADLAKLHYPNKPLAACDFLLDEDKKCEKLFGSPESRKGVLGFPIRCERYCNNFTSIKWWHWINFIQNRSRKKISSFFLQVD